MGQLWFLCQTLDVCQEIGVSWWPVHPALCSPWRIFEILALGALLGSGQHWASAFWMQECTRCSLPCPGTFKQTARERSWAGAGKEMRKGQVCCGWWQRLVLAVKCGAVQLLGTWWAGHHEGISSCILGLTWLPWHCCCCRTGWNDPVPWQWHQAVSLSPGSQSVPSPCTVSALVTGFSQAGDVLGFLFALGHVDINILFQNGLIKCTCS